MKTPSTALTALFLAAAGLAHAQTFEQLFSFPVNGSSGKLPTSTLTVGPDGALYGVCLSGGANNDGTAFKITTGGTFTLLGSLSTPTTGGSPLARLVDMGDGFLYGVTSLAQGVVNTAGTVFRVDPQGGISQVYQLPRQTPGVGGNPLVPLSLISVEPGVLHVLASRPDGLWRIPVADTAQSTIVYRFANPPDGVFAQSLSKDENGLLYGVTSGTGSGGAQPDPSSGTIFRIAPNGTGKTILHTCVYPTGSRPCGALTLASDGNFYGMMQSGGNGPSTGSNIEHGCVYRLTPAGVYSEIHIFGINGDTLNASTDSPNMDLLQASDGYLYGTTSSGGTFADGGVFRMKLDGTNYKVIQHFHDAAGQEPRGGLVQADDGHLYGTTADGGTGNVGMIYRIKLPTPPPNRAPLALNDSAFQLGDTATVINVLANDADPENGLLTVSIVTAPQFGNAVGNTNGTITYSPGGGFVGSDSFIYRITDPLGKSATATVSITDTPPAAAPLPGLYNGLVYLDPTLTGDGTVPRGQLVVKLTATGKLTGKLSYNGKRVGFKATAVNGIAVARVKLTGLLKAVLILGFDELTGGFMHAIVADSELWTGSIFPIAADPQIPTPPPVSYTFVLGATEPAGRILTGPAPEAAGFGTAKVTPKTGVVKCVGKMPDGTPISWATHKVDRTGGLGIPDYFVPVYAVPFKGGVCGGEQPFNNPGAENPGTLFWYRPSSSKPGAQYPQGFLTDLETLFVGYTPLTDLTTIVPVIVGPSTLTTGSRSGSVSATFTIEPTKVTPTAPLLAFKANKKTGTFTGKLSLGAKTVNFGGVFLRGLGAGGHFIFNGETDSLTFEF